MKRGMMKYIYRDSYGAPLYAKVREDRDGTKACYWEMPNGKRDLGEVQRVIYNLPDVIEAVKRGEWIVWAEGEKCAHLAADLGFVATTCGSSSNWQREMREFLRGARVAILPDRDESGRKHSDTVARDLVGVAAEVRIVPYMADVPGDENDGGDIEQWCDHFERDEDRLREMIEAAPPYKARHRVRSIQASKVDRREVHWLWPDVIAFRKLALVYGDPDRGKTTAMLDVIARATTGSPFPCHPQVRRNPINTMVISYEDDEGDTLRPRLEAAGADLDRVTIVRGIGDAEDLLTLPEDLPDLELAAREVHAEVVVIDPLNGALSGKIDGHRDHDIRRALAALKQFAERTGAAVVAIGHSPKGPRDKAIHALGGSIGTIAAARLAMYVTEDPEDTDRRILAVSKNNVGGDRPSFYFRLRAEPVLDTVAVEWIGRCPYTADELMQTAKPSERDRAVAFLENVLASGPRLRRDIEREAKAEGISWPTLERAKSEMGVRSHKRGFQKPSLWSLKEHPGNDDQPKNKSDHDWENGANSHKNPNDDQTPPSNVIAIGGDGHEDVDL